ncbi:MAG: rod shape-determining protein MreC [Deltaproteobacteria bacterium]|nr:rod shape-determining protein MreC [Deltaproteobacteria bacterium]
MLAMPFQKGFHLLKTSVSQVTGHYFFLVGTWEENQRLKTGLAELDPKRLLLGETLQENERLRALLKFRETVPWQMVAARIISNDPLSSFRLVTIDRGEADGLERRQPVVAATGLVGQVWRVWPRTAEILLITDPTSVVDGIVERNRARGLVTGKVIKTKLSREYFLADLEFMRKGLDLQEGDLMVTSGLDGFFPKGVPIGEIRHLKKGGSVIFQTADVIPFVDFMELEEVFVLISFKPML